MNETKEILMSDTRQLVGGAPMAVAHCGRLSCPLYSAEEITQARQQKLLIRLWNQAVPYVAPLPNRLLVLSPQVEGTV